MSVLLAPGEKAEYVFKLPHRPIPAARAADLARTSFDAKLAECRAFWRRKLAAMPALHLPEKRIDEMMRAGLLHLDLVAYGKEPDGAVAATIGVANTGVAQKSLEVFQNAKLPLIIPCATGTPLTTQYPAPESYIFRTSARDAIQAPYVVEDIVRRGWTHVAIFADTTGYGEGGYNDVVAALAAKNLKPVHVSRFALGVKDLSAELAAARTAGAEVIYSNTVGQENAVIANGKKALGWKVPQVGPWTLSFPFFLDGAKDAAEGALMVQTFIAEPSNERRASFLSSYTRKYQRKVAVPMAAANAYDATYLLMYSFLGIRDGNLAGFLIGFARDPPPLLSCNGPTAQNRRHHEAD